MDIDQSLEEIERAGRLRRLLTLTPDSPVYSEYMSKGLILFSSNDYLGLSSNGEVKAAVSEVVQRSGMGCRSAG
jgi:7-keto-8-aminopelargonate synthetase-like enzyme